MQGGSNFQEEKRRIKPVIVESGEENVPSPDSIEDNPVKEEPGGEEVKVVEPPPAPLEEKGGKLTLFLVALLVALFVALLAGGIYVYTTGVQEIESPEVATLSPVPKPSPEKTPTLEASATPVARMDLSKYKISVLNGSGKIGEAGKIRNLIEKEGFKVANIGNASSFDFEETTIQVKESVPEDVVSKLKDVLSGYSLVDGDTLGSSSAYDVVITVGAE